MQRQTIAEKAAGGEATLGQIKSRQSTAHSLFIYYQLGARALNARGH
jgi:hypothetical protein